MPFLSRKQSRAAFGGYLGSKMKSKAKEWASKTNYSDLPEYAGDKKDEFGKKKKKKQDFLSMRYK